MWRVLCVDVLLCAAVACSGRPRQDNDTSGGCPAFDRQLCGGSPSEELRDAFECLSGRDCAAGQRCCESCSFAFKICIKTIPEVSASRKGAYLANKFCPKVRRCSSPLKYDVRFRCGSDEVCPFGYKCCRGDCYIHRVCVLPTDAAGNRISPPTQFRSINFKEDGYGGSGSGAPDDESQSGQLTSTLLGSGDFNAYDFQIDSPSITSEKPTPNSGNGNDDNKIIDAIGKDTTDFDNFEIQHADDFYWGATQSFDYSGWGGVFTDDDDDNDNFLPGPDNSRSEITDEYVAEGSGSGNYEDGSKMFAVSRDTNNSDFYWASTEHNMISSATTADILKQETIVYSGSGAGSTDDDEDSDNESSTPTNVFRTAMLLLGFNDSSNLTYDDHKSTTEIVSNDNKIKTEISGSDDHRDSSSEWDYSGSGDDDEDGSGAEIISSTLKEAFPLVTPLTPIYLPGNPTTLRTTLEDRNDIIFIDDYDSDSNDLNAAFFTTIRSKEESGSGSGDGTVDEDTSEGSGVERLRDYEVIPEKDLPGSDDDTKFSLTFSTINETVSSTVPLRDTVSSISQEGTSTEYPTTTEFSGSGNWGTDEDTRLIYSGLPNSDDELDTFSGSGDDLQTSFV